jgi:hypothetical protein
MTVGKTNPMKYWYVDRIVRSHNLNTNERFLVRRDLVFEAAHKLLLCCFSCLGPNSGHCNIINVDDNDDTEIGFDIA